MSPQPMKMSEMACAVATATRGPDMLRCWSEKGYGSCVIRYWVDGWEYGIKSSLPFVVVAYEPSETDPLSSTLAPEPTGRIDYDSRRLDHYAQHVVAAAAHFGLPVIGVPPEILARLPFPPSHVVEVVVPRGGLYGDWHHWAHGWIAVFSALGHGGA